MVAQHNGQYVSTDMTLFKDKLIEHKQDINRYGEDMPEIRDWKWGNLK